MLFLRPIAKLVLVVSISVLLTACGSSGGGGGDSEDELIPLNDSELLPVARCTALHVNAVARLIEHMQNLFDVINGDPLPASIIEITPLTEYTFQLDLEPDNVTDITVNVVIVTGATDISDGMQDGELITVNLMFQGAITGNVSLDFSFFAFLGLMGSISFDDGGTCSFQMPNMFIVWEVGNTGSTIVGDNFSSTEGSDTFSGTLAKGSLEDIITALGQLDVGGNPPVDTGFVINLDTFEVFED